MRCLKPLIALLLFAFGAASGETELPHTFQAGEPARASEVNENLDVLVTAIDANAARLGAVVLDGNGSEIGQLVSIGENFWNIVVINSAGYIQSIGFQDGSLSGGTLVYESSDCTGQPYAPGTTFGGHVQKYYDAFGTPSIYYVDKSAVPITNFNANSLSWESGCEAQSSVGATVWPVTVNDAGITGVSSDTYLLPIRIERAN